MEEGVGGKRVFVCRGGGAPVFVDVDALEGHHLGAGGDDDVLGLDGLAAAVLQLHLHAALRRDLAPPLLVLHLQVIFATFLVRP